MSELRLDCLGSGHAFSHGRYWSGYLLAGRILLDCPPQTLPHLYRLGVPTHDLDLVLLSHQHSDHIGGMDLLLLEAMHGHHLPPLGERREARARPLAVAGPPGIHDRLREIIGDSDRLPDRDDPSIVWLESEGGSSFEWAGALVECVEMDHAADIPALGFRVQLDGRTVAYTGDTRLCPAVERLAEGADLLIAECGGDAEHGHMSWDDIRALRETLPASTRILVTHYAEPADRAALEAIDGLELAEDFAVYEV